MTSSVGTHSGNCPVSRSPDCLPGGDLSFRWLALGFPATPYSASFATEGEECHIFAEFLAGFYDNDKGSYFFKIGNQDLTDDFGWLQYSSNGNTVLDADVPSMTCDQFVGKTFTIDHEERTNTMTSIGAATITAEKASTKPTSTD